MPGLTRIRDAAVDLLRRACPGLARVEPFGGEITSDGVADKALPPGVSILVAAIGAENDAGQDSLDLDVVGSFGAIIVASNVHSPEAREADALAIAETAALALHGATFGLAGVSPARVHSLEAVRDQALDRAGVSLWSIVWQQAFVFGGA